MRAGPHERQFPLFVGLRCMLFHSDAESVADTVTVSAPSATPDADLDQPAVASGVMVTLDGCGSCVASGKRGRHRDVDQRGYCLAHPYNRYPGRQCR